MTLAAPAGWRNDGPDAWGKIPPCCDCPETFLRDEQDALDEVDAFGWDDEGADLEPELVPVPVKRTAPDIDAPIPVEWPTRIVQPVPLARR